MVLVTGRCQRALKTARIRTLAEISPFKVENALRVIADDGKRKMTSRTKGFYLASIKQFSEWAFRQGRITLNPIEHLSVKFAGDVKKRRRPLTVEEVRTLVTATDDGPERYRIRGPDRALLYAFTAETGCRAGEVAAFRAGDFDLSDELASVTIRSDTTKNRTDCSLLLSTGLSALLRDPLSRKAPESKAFSTPRLDAFAKLLRKDCDAAGIPTVDGSGREVDSHAHMIRPSRKAVMLPVAIGMLIFSGPMLVIYGSVMGNVQGSGFGGRGRGSGIEPLTRHFPDGPWPGTVSGRTTQL